MFGGQLCQSVDCFVTREGAERIHGAVQIADQPLRISLCDVRWRLVHTEVRAVDIIKKAVPPSISRTAALATTASGLASSLTSSAVSQILLVLFVAGTASAAAVMQS